MKPGEYRARIVGIAPVGSSTTGSAGIECTCVLLASVANGVESPVEPETVHGTMWIVRRDGSLNEKACETATKILGIAFNETYFDYFRSFAAVDCHVTLESEMYKDKERIKVAWFNPIKKYADGDSPEERVARAMSAKLGRTIAPPPKPIEPGDDSPAGDEIPF